MQRSIIAHQIDNFDYLEALKFIQQHGDESFANRFLSLAKSSFTESKVLKHLEKWLDTIPQEKVSVDIKIDGSLATSQSADLDDLKLTRNNLVKERDVLRGQLELIPSDEERKKVARRIVYELNPELQQTWEDINTLEAGKELPKPEPDDKLEAIFEGVKDKLQLDKIRRNHISYLSKARKGNRPKELIPFYESVIAEAERRMK